MRKRRLPQFPGICLLLAGLSGAAVTPRAEASAGQAQWPGSVQAEYRGCESGGWCWFLASLAAESLLRVRPAGIAIPGDPPPSNAVRDRLNALLAGMIHQHNRIVLNDLRKLDDGTFEAEVTVNETNLASDPVLLELSGKRGGVDR